MFKISKKKKGSMDMTLNEFINLTSTWWKENYQPINIDTTENRHTGEYKLGLNSLFVPESSPF